MIRFSQDVRAAELAGARERGLVDDLGAALHGAARFFQCFLVVFYVGEIDDFQAACGQEIEIGGFMLESELADDL